MSARNWLCRVVSSICIAINNSVYRGVNALQTFGRSFPCPFSHFPLPLSLFPPLPSLPFNPARGLGSAVSSPSRSGRNPAIKRIFVHFEVKVKHFYFSRYWFFLYFNRRNCEIFILGVQHIDGPLQVKHCGVRTPATPAALTRMSVVRWYVPNSVLPRFLMFV